MVADPPREVALDVPAHVGELDRLRDQQCVLPGGVVDLARCDQLEREHGWVADHRAAVAGELILVPQDPALVCEGLLRPGHPVRHPADQLSRSGRGRAGERGEGAIDERATREEQEIDAVGLAAGAASSNWGGAPGSPVSKRAANRRIARRWHRGLRAGPRRCPACGSRGRRSRRREPGRRQHHDAGREAPRRVREDPQDETDGVELAAERAKVGAPRSAASPWMREWAVSRRRPHLPKLPAPPNELQNPPLPCPPHAPVAQLDRASVYETEGHRFESCRARSPLARKPLHQALGTQDAPA